jgi:NAD(P)-dependent dehydrogenase (short-subunit alcohol dehydrogenase family)
MKKLEGKVAVITGGNSGIGLATAQRFVDEGAYVFITGRRQSELDAAVKQIGKNNNNVTGVQGDVSNLADLDRLYATVKEQKGRIDILFANAGVGATAIEIDPKFSNACLNKGVALDKLGKDEEARESYEKSKMTAKS